jgi:AraC-like DNA-binding protein
MDTLEVPPLPFSSIEDIDGPLVFVSNNWRWTTKMPDYFNLWVALDGQGELNTLGKTYQIHPGTAFVFSPHQEVSAEKSSDQPVRNFACRFFQPRDTAQTMQDYASRLMGIQARDLALTKALCRAAIQSKNYDDELSKQQTNGLCYQLLARIWRDAHMPQHSDPDMAILRLIERLREQPSERLNLEEMAAATKLSLPQFNRRFMALTGESPVNFSIRQRIVHAKHYLSGSSLQISEIANILGYTDIYFFSRQFKKDTGMSPSAYRQASILQGEALSADLNN